MWTDSFLHFSCQARKNDMMSLTHHSFCFVSFFLPYFFPSRQTDKHTHIRTKPSTGLTNTCVLYNRKLTISVGFPFRATAIIYLHKHIYMCMCISRYALYICSQASSEMHIHADELAYLYISAKPRAYPHIPFGNIWSLLKNIPNRQTDIHTHTCLLASLFRWKFSDRIVAFLLQLWGGASSTI